MIREVFNVLFNQETVFGKVKHKTKTVYVCEAMAVKFFKVRLLITHYHPPLIVNVMLDKTSIHEIQKF